MHNLKNTTKYLKMLLQKVDQIIITIKNGKNNLKHLELL